MICYNTSMDIITRNDAIISGLRKYFTGKPCINAHISERYTKSGTCRECIESNNKEQADFERWNAAQRDAEDEEKLGERIMQQKGLEAWAEWMLKTAELRLLERERRDAATGRWKQFLAATACRHRKRMRHPDGRILCRDCDQEMPEVIPMRRGSKNKTHFLPDDGSKSKSGKLSFLPEITPAKD